MNRAVVREDSGALVEKACIAAVTNASAAVRRDLNAPNWSPVCRTKAPNPYISVDLESCLPSCKPNTCTHLLAAR